MDSADGFELKLEFPFLFVFLRELLEGEERDLDLDEDLKGKLVEGFPGIEIDWWGDFDFDFELNWFLPLSWRFLDSQIRSWMFVVGRCFGIVAGEGCLLWWCNWLLGLLLMAGPLFLP